MKDYEVNLSMMKKCRLYIDENLDKGHLLKGPALAKHFKYSYTNFRRIFIAVGGYDVLEYIQMRKVQKAAKRAIWAISSCPSRLFPANI